VLPDGFCGIQILPNSITAGGAYDASPDSPSRLGSGTPSLFPTPLDASGAAVLSYYYYSVFLYG